MALLHIPFEQIDEARLEALKAAAASESRLIDYKRTTYGANDHAEFLADISSFANTSGGDIVLGIAEQGGIPTAFVPLTLDADAEVLRLEQIARTGLQPRLSGIQIKVIPIKAGGNILLIRVPRSYNPPHRIIRQNSNRFWARSSAGKFEPDVDELRNLFTAAPLLMDRIREFRIARGQAILAGNAPVTLMNRGILVLFVVPFSAFDFSASVPIEAQSQDYHSFPPLGSRSAQGVRVNFDGVLKLSNAGQPAQQERAYVQLYRNGIVEAVTSTIINTAKSGIPIIANLDLEIIANSARYMRDLASTGIEPPYALLVGIIGVRGARFNLSTSAYAPYYDNLGTVLDRDQYDFVEIIFETIPQSVQEFAQKIRPALDQMANTSGAASSPSFDRDGRFIEPR